MPTRTSAGILLYRLVDGRLEVLLAHPGGPFFATRDDDVWSIPKGEPDADEPFLDVAAREFEEETGHPVPDGPRIELGSIVQKGGKVVHAWAVEGDLDPATAVSNTVRDDVAAEIGPDGDISRDRPRCVVRAGRGPPADQGGPDPASRAARGGARGAKLTAAGRVPGQAVSASRRIAVSWSHSTRNASWPLFDRISR